jgi:hypothetical protein
LIDFSIWLIVSRKGCYDVLCRNSVFRYFASQSLREAGYVIATVIADAVEVENWGAFAEGCEVLSQIDGILDHRIHLITGKDILQVENRLWRGEGG